MAARLLLTALCCLLVVTQAQDKKDLAQVKLAKMIELRDKSSNGIIEFTADMYK
jgi:hypothetical protein